MLMYGFVQECVRKHHSDGTLSDVVDTLEVSYPFDGLETEYLQRKYYKENCKLLVRL